MIKRVSHIELTQNYPNGIRETGFRYESRSGERPMSKRRQKLIQDSHRDKKENPMKSSTEDQAKGMFHEVKGKVKEEVGKLTNSPDMEAEGKEEKNAGKVQKKIGQAEKVLGE